MTYTIKKTRETRAVIAGLQTAETSDFDFESSLNELERLVRTLGFVPVGRVTQKRKNPASGTIFGKGKLSELASWTGGSGVIQGFKKSYDPSEDEDEVNLEETPEALPLEASMEEFEGRQANVVILDCELTPTQLSNLEEATGVEVLDRTGVILEIFNRHAKSQEARLQVEIAKLAYLAPRLRASHIGSDRQGGGIGAKGAGESAHELDRRRIRDRIAELRNQLKSIRTAQINRRSHREELPVVALIGYTNAGKSSLMRQLTHTNVEGEDKLFATLDTTVRTLQPETVPKILISDTVGFIKKLPHDLVASFRSTLDEAQHADLLLFTVDGSDPNFRSQLDVTKEVIADIGASDNPSHLIINKVDLLSKEEQYELRKEFPHAILISTQEKLDVDRMRRLILDFFEKDMEDREILIPFSQGQLIGKIRSRARVIEESYDEQGTTLKIRANSETFQWISQLF